MAMIRRLSLLIATSALFCVQSATAQSEPVCQSAEYEQLDFWVGDWQVYNEDDQLAGENSITKSADGCQLLEHWSGQGGASGHSQTFYNPATEKWRQVWVGSGSIIDIEGGMTETGSMKLTGRLTYFQSRTNHDFSGEWTPLEDGRVKQHFEIENAETGKWGTWFTGFYSRKPDATD